MTYGKFAKTYQKLMDSSLYEKWVQYVEKNVSKNSRLLELACGSGEVANLLYKKGYTIIGSDISSDMLTLAFGNNANIQWLQLDMTEFELDESFDSVICFADSICYLKDENTVQKMFQCVYDVLIKDGVFLFDVHSIYQMNTIFKDYSYHYVDDDTVFVWESFEGKYPNSVEHELTCVEKQYSGSYERYEELHEQRTYTLEQYRAWLQGAGFKTIEVTSDFGNSQIVTDDTTRWFFKCVK